MLRGWAPIVNRRLPCQALQSLVDNALGIRNPSLAALLEKKPVEPFAHERCEDRFDSHKRWEFHFNPLRRLPDELRQRRLARHPGLFLTGSDAATQH